MWLPMPDSLQGSTPHPTLLLIHLVPVKVTVLASYHPHHPPTPKMILKVPPQSLLTLRMVTPSKQSVVTPKLSSFHLIYLFSLFWFIQLI